MKNHDNAFRRNQCGRGNMTANNNTSAATTTTTATPTPTTTAINGHSNSTSSAAGAAEILPPKSASNSSTPPPASVARPPANPIGSATVPRRRLLTSSALSGGNTSAAGTATTTSDEVDGVLSAEACRGRSAERKLAALDNLDLALSLELNDEDGEDPYFALQEYLERVKTEINEVFEQHKARQRLQQQQEQQHDDGATDELTRSTESDSGFDSASGNNGRPPKTSRAAVSTAATRATDETKVTEINALGRRNGQASPPVSNSSSSSNRNSNNNTQLQFDVVATTATSTDGNQTQPTTTKLHALPPPPLSPSGAAEGETNNNNGSHTSSTLQRLRKQLQAKADAAAAAVAAANNGSSASAAAADEVSIWANKFLRDLDNLMGSDKSAASSLSAAATATAAVSSRSGPKGDQQQARDQTGANGLVLRPEKHATIPLQSFNLDCGGGFVDSSSQPRQSVAYLRTLSAPAPTPQHHQQHHQHDNRASMAAGDCSRSLAAFNGEQHDHHRHHQQQQQQQQSSQQQHHQSLGNVQRTLTPEPTMTATTTILKIEEAAAAAAAAAAEAAAEAEVATGGQAQRLHKADEEWQRQRRQRQLENDMETIRNALLSQSQQLAAMEASNGGSGKNTLVASAGAAATATSIPKQERINQPAASVVSAAASSMSISPSSTLTTPSKPHGGSMTTGTTTTSYLLNGSDATKKGSTSTIWTSEESILRSVGAVDEDNNSTSSSACEEASGVLSSGKSGISLDSSGLDNDNNESGIGTATPPKDLPYWKSARHHHHHDNESVNSLDALRKMKFQKSGSVASSDDPDLLEVLSLCDEPQGDDDHDNDVDVDVDDSLDADDIDDQHHRHSRHQSQQQTSASSSQQHQRRRRQLAGSNNKSNNNGDEEDDDVAVDDDATADLDDDEVDEGHDEFETVTYCDFTDGDASSASGVGASTATATAAGSSEAGAVLLRRKFNAAPPIMVPYGRAQKSRSHSLDTASLPSALPFNHHHQPHSHHLHHFHHPLPHPSQLARKLHHLQPSSRAKERGQLSLTLRQEPFQSLLSPTTHFQELPSPSSASLHSGHESLGIQELTTKSNSAPLLLKQERKRDDFAGQNLTLRYSRSQSDRYLAEIEAVEACKWLRAAGFPQYAQMYEDHQFPIDLTNVAKDHTNLENDQLQSLYRRLCILNRCANMRLDQSHKAQTPQKEESDDENFALSENWTFQPHIRRWSRIGEMGLELPPGGLLGAEKTESSSKESSPDRFEDDAYDVSGAGLTLTLPGQGGGGDSTDTTLNDSADASGVRLRRTGSERLKDGAKALLRRVESIKSRRRKRQNREGIVISGPQALDLSQLGQQRSSVRKPDAVYSTPPSPSAVSPMHSFPKSPFFGNELKVPSHSENFLSPNRASPKRTPTTPRSMRTSPLHFFSNPMPHLREGKSDDSSSYFSDSQESSAGGKLSFSLRKTPSKTRRFLQRTGKVDDIGAHSDSECHQGRKLLIKDANSNTTEVKIKKLSRGGSLNLGKDPKKRDGFRSSSFRSRSTTRKDVKTTDDADTVKRTPVVRWHSFQMEERPHMIFRKCFSQKIDPNAGDHGFPFAAMSAGQLQIIRKLALVILTGYMERYCPTHRSGWNWELPKFIKKIKMPDYKDKKVFGVPLLLVLQRTGQTLPVAVRSAFRWLQLNALDQIGLFRKSGVKSRIIKLKELIEYSETSAECMEVFDAQQAYDVADMLKQYFRDLPESLLTTKMSETFAAIFLHLPPDVRLDAVQCAVLLLPDENREILYALLEFLTLVADNSQYNQMTANNLAVCLAPSLFHNSISTGASSVTASPRRRKGAGVPDVKELSEAKASHECLAFMIENYRKIYTATKEKINKCNFGYMEESKPVPLEALGEGMQFHNWRGYLYECTSATIKEGREKTRGWFTITSLSDPNVEIAYKKVGDGHPLRLWRCITEVEGPPKDVLEYVIRQRASWDASLLQSQTVKKLDERTDIFQYAVDGQITTDFCVLRSWQTDLPRGACVIVETSIEHAKAKPIYGSVRGVVLASRYLIEPCGSGRSRVMHLARVDIKGKTPEWYNKSYGHICSHHLSRIRAAFKNVADGPESKV